MTGTKTCNRKQEETKNQPWVNNVTRDRRYHYCKDNDLEVTDPDSFSLRKCSGGILSLATDQC